MLADRKPQPCPFLSLEIARQLHDWTPLLGRLAQQGMSRDFR